MQKTSSGNRIHIGFFGKVNSGKSSLINAFAGREISLVSDVVGTTTDPVYKSMEIGKLGPCLLMDTPGFNDTSILSELRQKRTQEVLEKTDIAIIVLTQEELEEERDLIKKLKDSKILLVINKIDILPKEKVQAIEKQVKNLSLPLVKVSAKNKVGMEEMKKELLRFTPERERELFEGLVEKKDTVLLVIPQDMAAPKNRLILPQVQSIRELLDKNALVLMVKLEEYEDMLEALKEPPNLIVADSSVFQQVYEKKPSSSKLTSFSVLFAKLKGDIDAYVEGVKGFEKIDENSKILIAECCTHAPVEEDIGRVKIPAMLRKKFGENLQVEVKSGSNLPENLSDYDLIIQCGGCMLNRKNILSRMEKAKLLHIPITNYGITLAYFKGILDKIIY